MTSAVNTATYVAQPAFCRHTWAFTSVVTPHGHVVCRRVVGMGIGDAMGEIERFAGRWRQLWILN